VLRKTPPAGWVRVEPDVASRLTAAPWLPTALLCDPEGPWKTVTIRTRGAINFTTYAPPWALEILALQEDAARHHRQRVADVVNSFTPVVSAALRAVDPREAETLVGEAVLAWHASGCSGVAAVVASWGPP
jgi:hypothetical protein